MIDGETIAAYDSPEEAVSQLMILLEDSGKRLSVAAAGHEMVATRYSKQAQWKRFEALVASI
jgi:hypothetical protein